MSPEIIVMLTHNDVTVPNARECFEQAADLPIKYWGFKDNGLALEEMKLLVKDFQKAGKTPVLESVTFDHDELLKAANIAIECGIEYFTGSKFSQEIADLVHKSGLKYFPFCGEISGPVISLSGTAQDVIQSAHEQLSAGADGVDLVAYRYVSGDPVDLAKKAISEIGRERVIIAGSINSRERMSAMQDINPFGYTMGGALFESAFVPGGSFRENLAKVVEIKAELESK